MNSCPTCYGTIRNRPGNVSPEGTRVQLCSDKWHDLTPLYAALDALSARVAKLEAALIVAADALDDARAICTERADISAFVEDDDDEVGEWEALADDFYGCAKKARAALEETR